MVVNKPEQAKVSKAHGIWDLVALKGRKRWWQQSSDFLWTESEGMAPWPNSRIAVREAYEWLLVSREVRFGSFMSVTGETSKEQFHDDLVRVLGRASPRSIGSWSTKFQGLLWKIPWVAEDLELAVSLMVQWPAEGSLQEQNLPSIYCVCRAITQLLFICHFWISQQLFAIVILPVF